MPTHSCIYVTACLIAATAINAHADPEPAVTPYRPSVSTPAALPAPGWLEVEAGWERGRSESSSHRDALPYTLKLALSPDWGLRVGGQAWVREVDASGTARRGAGDTGFVLKRRFAINDASAFGMELGVIAPTASGGLGSGHTDVGLNGIYSADFFEVWHTDLNLTATRLGDDSSGGSRWQTGWAGSFSRNLNDRWSVTGELSGTQQRGADHTAQMLFAASYSMSRRIALDAGVSKGLNRASGDWTVFAGMTFLAFKLF